METIIDWKRITTAIYHKADRKYTIDEITDKVIPILSKLSEITGEYTSYRKTLTIIGSQLLLGSPKVIVPVCPDYSHENDLYTMKYVLSDISLVAQKHVNFIKHVSTIIPELQVEFLVADQESEDELLCCKMGLDKDKFLERIIKSKDALQRSISQFGWSAQLMTNVFPNLVMRENELTQIIQSNDAHKRLIEYDTSNRDSLYAKIDATLSREEKIKRTVRTAAQYYSLGEFCATHGYFVCNHTTTNLAWYTKAGVGIIHNPVRIY